jgi:aryl-alcohol dehydrogenase-like predicted oxidoreductase
MTDKTTSTLSLDRYRLLGRSGLRVSPLSLGAMTFGTDWGWGADEQESRRMFDAYVDRGGNFIDTANQYTGGTSETLVGRFAEGRRDELVIATKYTITSRPRDPNSGGNHRRSMVRSVEDSLKRLNTDYIDLFYLHASASFPGRRSAWVSSPANIVVPTSISAVAPQVPSAPARMSLPAMVR